MVQSLIVYLAVALAAAWVAWNVLLPKVVKARVRSALSPRRQVPAGPAAKTDGCACGGGDCKD